MTKEEQQAIARSQVQAVRPMGISRDEKLAIYYSLVSGLMQCEDYRHDHLMGMDKLLDDAIRDYKRRAKNALLTG